MNSNEESLDSELLTDGQPFIDQMEATWSYFALVCIGCPFVLFLANFSLSFNDWAISVNTSLDLATRAMTLYVVWYLKTICNKLLNTSSANLPIYVLMVLMALQLVFYFLELDYSKGSQGIILSFHSLLLVISKIWLIVTLLRIRKQNSLQYIRMWAFALIISMIGTMVSPILLFFNSDYMNYQQHVTHFFSLLPDLTLLLFILTEPRLNVVKAIS